MAATIFDRVTRAGMLLLAILVVILALPFVGLALILAATAGLMFRAAGYVDAKPKGDSA